MAWEQPVMNESTRLAAIDLRDNQFRFVKLDADGLATKITAATDLPYGIQQNDARIGEAVVVMRLGVSKLVGVANLASGDIVGTAADGRATKLTLGTDTTKFVTGVVVDGNGSANSIGSVSVSTLAPHRAA